jgi:hypothetical protein
MSTAIDPVVDKLCAVSRRAFVDPYLALEWPEELPADAWCMTPELVSLYGTGAWLRASEEEQKRIAFFEAVSFFSLNISGEKALIAGLSQRLYAPSGSATRAELSPYIHHFLDEENKHMIYFGTFCRKYAGKTYPEAKMALPREYAPGEEDLLFFIKVMIFEEIVDAFNVRMARDGRLHPLVRQINELHHLDETRHLAFGRLVVKELFEKHAPAWSAETISGVRRYATSYLEATWRDYFNPSAYRDAGLDDPYGLMREALASEASRERRSGLSERCVRSLTEIGILTEDPHHEV